MALSLRKTASSYRGNHFGLHEYASLSDSETTPQRSYHCARSRGRERLLCIRRRAVPGHGDKCMPLPLPLVATARARSYSTLGRVIISPSKTTHSKNAAVRRRARRIFHSLSRRFRGIVRLDGVLPRPLACGSLIAGAVSLVDVRNFGNKRVVGVRVSQH